jgi:hypothetical protein
MEELAMRLHILVAVLAAVLLPASVVGDDWKDESGKKKGHYKAWGKYYGGPPPWSRARGWWERRFDDVVPPPPHEWESDAYEWYPPHQGWYEWDDDAWEHEKELRKQHKEWLKAEREREKKAYEKWHEWRKERYERHPYRRGFQDFRPWRGHGDDDDWDGDDWDDD